MTHSRHLILKACFIGALALLLAGVNGAAWGQAPRLSISQVGLHFICTADGQPDMYSWRNPVKDTREGAGEGDYIIPAFEPSNPNISGGRTALKVDEHVFNAFEVEHGPATGFDGSTARLTNLREVNWSSESAPPDWIKGRYYSNYPPLSNEGAGLYGTVGFDTDVNRGRYYLRHPGYNPANWNWTLEPDRPLDINEKRIQAMLHLELRLPEGGSADEVLNYSFVISGEDMRSIQVNGERVFTRNEPLVVKTQKSLFWTSPSTELHTFADARRLSLGRRAMVGSRRMDTGYSYNPNSTAMSTNLDLSSALFTVLNHESITFDSGLITIRIYNSHVAANTTEVPVQTVQFRLPAGLAPSPDLVVAGSGKVNYITASASVYNHPAVQAPRWWSFSRDGIIARFNKNGSPIDEPVSTEFNSVKGRFFEWPTVSISSDRMAINPLSPLNGDRQRVPGARALIYGHDASFYPDVGYVSVEELMMEPSRRIEYQGPDFDRPVHYGSDTLRLLKNVNPLVPRAHVSESEFQPEENYSNPNFRIVSGFAEEQPRISLHPVSTVLERGGQVRMTVGVANGPVTYQWRFKGEPIHGATTSSLLVTDMSREKAGAYEVVATNVKGSTSSKPAILSLPGPVITAQPADILASAGAEAMFAVTVEADDLEYQWRRNGLAIENANSATLILKQVKLADEGHYDVLAKNVDGMVVSDPAELRIKRSLAILQQPLGGSLRVGGTLVLKVLATGDGPLVYVWRRDGQVVPEADTDRLVLTATGEDDAAGSYEVEISNGSGSVTSQRVAVNYVGMPPVITQHPVNQTASEGGQATFTVQAEAENLTYQWRLNGANVAKGNGASLLVSGVKTKNLGSYDCVVGNAHGSTLSKAATLKLSSALGFSVTPLDQVATPGGTATFAAQASEDSSLATYQWAFNGKDIEGAIYPDLSIPEVKATQAGNYSVTLSLNGEEVTASAKLHILEPGVLVYKLSGTGQTTTGAKTTRVALKGFLLVNRSAQPPEGALLLVTKDGRYNRYQVRNLDNLRVDSTGPAMKTQTAISAITDDEDEPPFRSQLWMQGADSLVNLSKTDQALVPKTLSGSANQLVMGAEAGQEKVTLETVSFKAALDLQSTATARQNEETVANAIERLKLDLQMNGSVEEPEADL